MIGMWSVRKSMSLYVRPPGGASVVGT